MQISPARRAAFEILRRVEEEDAYASALLATLDDSLRPDDRGLCHELVLGVLRRRLWLDRSLEHFSSRRIDDVDLPVRLALRLGLYQLRFLSRIPPSAAVNESVNLARAARLKSAASFVNAVLRRATREPGYDPTTSIADPIEKLSIETSHPRWLIERWHSAFGAEEAALLAQANNEPAPIAFRFTAKALSYEERGAEAIIDELREFGAELEPSSIASNSWRLLRPRTSKRSSVDDAGTPQARMPALLRTLSQDGLIYFQDEASQLVAHLLAAQSGDRVLDVCAAPGSKSTLIAALAPQAMIVAGDLHEHRLATIKEIAASQRTRNIYLIAHDATRELPFPGESFDRVLVDAPCSGTGTLRHSPEIRWRLETSDIAELTAKQMQILHNASATVRRGGILLYSTCSVEIDENETVVRDFIDGHPDFEGLPLPAPSNLLTGDGSIRTWPHRDDVDGFFVKAVQRTGSNYQP